MHLRSSYLNDQVLKIYINR